MCILKYNVFCWKINKLFLWIQFFHPALVFLQLLILLLPKVAVTLCLLPLLSSVPASQPCKKSSIPAAHQSSCLLCMERETLLAEWKNRAQILTSFVPATCWSFVLGMGWKGTERGRHLMLHKLNDTGDCLMITTGNAIVAVERSSHASVSINYGFTQQLKFWSQFWL